MSDKDVMKWLAGFFIATFVIAMWLNSQPHTSRPECDNAQYSTQSC